MTADEKGSFPLTVDVVTDELLILTDFISEFVNVIEGIICTLATCNLVASFNELAFKSNWRILDNTELLCMCFLFEQELIRM